MKQLCENIEYQNIRINIFQKGGICSRVPKRFPDCLDVLPGFFLSNFLNILNCIFYNGCICSHICLMV
jgi:hypothetical protein